MNLALVRADIAGERGDRIGIIEIDPHEPRRCALGQLARGVTTCIDENVAEHEARAGFCTGARNGATDATRSASNNDRAPGQHRSLSARPRESGDPDRKFGASGSGFPLARE